MSLFHRSSGKKGSYEIDMVNGPLLGKIVRFAVPLGLSGILQLLFNAADIVVVGKFAGSTALAAVGSTSSLINLIVNLFIGLSIGANVLVARCYGAGQKKDLKEAVHTAITASLVCGAVLVVIGVTLARSLLFLMGSPPKVIDQAALYMRIFFLGMPVNMLYNFGAAVLRAVGDTKRPLYFLLISGVVNVILNLFFVIVCHLGVAGVAIATVVSQVISAVLVILCLMKSDGPYRLEFKSLGVKKDKLLQMVKIGLPAGIQGAIFSISNVLIQSSINSFGDIAMAGSAAAANIEGFVYTGMNAFYQAALSFTGQNLGAGKPSRVKKIMVFCLLLVSGCGLVLGVGAYLLGRPLLGIYSSDAQVIEYGLERLAVICALYFLCGVMDVMVGMLRGMGYSIVPMIVSIVGVCGFRVGWIYTVFSLNRSLFVLYLSYPVSWVITGGFHLICYFFLCRKVLRPKIRMEKQAVSREGAGL